MRQIGNNAALVCIAGMVSIAGIVIAAIFKGIVDGTALVALVGFISTIVGGAVGLTAGKNNNNQVVK